MLDTLDSLDGETAQPAPVLRIQIQAIRRPVRSQDDGQLQLCVPLVPSGWARCTSAPASASVSAAQYHPYVAPRFPDSTRRRDQRVPQSRVNDSMNPQVRHRHEFWSGTGTFVPHAATQDSTRIRTFG